MQLSRRNCPIIKPIISLISVWVVWICPNYRRSCMYHCLMVIDLTFAKLSTDVGQPIDEPTLFQSVTPTHLDLVFTVNRICQYMHRPTDFHQAEFCASYQTLQMFINGFNWRSMHNVSQKCQTFEHIRMPN